MKKVFVVLQFERLYNRYKRYRRSTNHMWVPPKMNLIFQITLYLVPAMIIFIFFPAMLFTYFEGWDYTISVYYAFVTLTTIGRRIAWLNLSNCKRAFPFLYFVLSRFRWLCAHVSTAPRANFRHLLRLLSAFHPRLVYRRYVSHIHHSSINLITDAGVIVNFQITILISIFLFPPFLGVGYLVMIIGFLIKLVYLPSMASIFYFNERLNLKSISRLHQRTPKRSDDETRAQPGDEH